MSEEKDTGGPMRARSDLIDILKANPENTEAIVTLIEGELKGLKDSDTVSEVTKTLDDAASKSEIDSDARDNVLYWLTQTNPDVRQMIMVRTIEELLSMDDTRETALAALARISSQENVNMVMEWIRKKILTLNQGVFVLLYPDSSDALK